MDAIGAAHPLPSSLLRVRAFDAMDAVPLAQPHEHRVASLCEAREAACADSAIKTKPLIEQVR